MSNQVGFLFFGPSEATARQQVLNEVQNKYGFPQSCTEAAANLAELTKAEADLKSGYPTRVQERYIAAYDQVIPILQEYIAGCPDASQAAPGTGTTDNTPPAATAPASNNWLWFALLGIVILKNHKFKNNGKRSRSKN